MDLRPALLDLGVVAAIEWQAREFEKQLGIVCTFTANVQELDLHPDQATALFRIFQEALTNISKHAAASQVQVTLQAGDGCVRLEVADNGRGIATTDRLKTKSFGIRGMIERAAALGGNLTVATGIDGGTVVALTIPLPAPAGDGGRQGK
jgi:signal transduction histidine kinase